jgi:hypothetical protein
MANSLWAAGCVPEYARFRRGVRRVAEEQEAVLRRIVKENADTEFGRAHGFSSLRTPAEYQQQVPLRDYDELEPWISRAANGVRNVLTREPIRLFEPTSGSSGSNKLIPFTSALQREFQRGINSWIADLYAATPQLIGGPAYWSISPATAVSKKTPGGIPIGFDDDTSYLGGWRKHLVQAVMAVPSNLRFEPQADTFRYVTLFHLVRARELRLISIWSPTFLLLLLDQLNPLSERILHDLEHGTHCAADPVRARELLDAIHTSSPQETYKKLWPKLQLISCWKDANSATPASKLATFFPHVQLQGKGLIATEAFVSFPLSGHDDSVLSLRSHFLEFLPNHSDRPILAHQLECGCSYSVVVTTSGGLYRYRLRDQIQVTGRIQNCPLIRFVGREGIVADWFGEKLNDVHVSRVFEETFRRFGITASFSMLACDITPPAGYVLYLDTEASEDVVARCAEAIEMGLSENIHYDYARRLGQLACVRVVRVPGGAKSYFDEAARHGQIMGRIKVPALCSRNAASLIFDSSKDKSSALL